MIAKEERNKTLVLEAMACVFRRKDPLSIERLYAADFIHHDPELRQGRQVFARIEGRRIKPLCIFVDPAVVSD